MPLWGKARRVHVVLPLALGVFVLLVLLVQNTQIALPSITGRSQVALSLFVPLPLVVGLMMSLESRLPAAEASGVRPVAVLDAALTMATLVAAVILSWGAGVLFGLPQAAAAGRNALLLTGLMLCARALVGQPAVMIPVAWLILVVFVGFRGPGDPYPWAVVPEPAGAFRAAICSVLVFLAGLLIQLRTSRTLS